MTFQDDATPGVEKDSKNVRAVVPTSMKVLVGVLGVCTVGLLAATIALAVNQDNNNESSTPSAGSGSGGAVPPPEQNPCAGKRPDLENIACIANGVAMTGEQSGVNVTKGYQGSRETDSDPITKKYSEVGLCPVNVHWHLGTEHYSKGEYDETGKGPIEFHEGRIGFQCTYYDDTDPKFTTEYNWQNCIGMTMGQTYEVHWPHSAAGMCGTNWQYQTPFYDGVFCKDGVLTDTAAQIGVQSQTFTIVNDEAYFYSDLFKGMIIDANEGKGTDLAIYTGSTTGTARDNKICSQFSPITWQVDRKCHLISASSFDKMCGEMKVQWDNLDDDLYAHGSRTLVIDQHAANNQQRKLQSRNFPTISARQAGFQEM